MQQPTIENVAGSKVKLTFTVTPEEAKPYLDEAVKVLSESKPIPGFRPGKAPYAEVVKAFGEMRIYETALEQIVRAMYMRAVLDNDLDTVGSPEIQVDKLTPGQDFQFTVIAPVAPSVKKMPDYSKPLVEYHARKIEEKDVNVALQDLRKMQRKEIASTEPAGKEDLVVIDMDMKKDHVALEDGVARDYRVYLAEEHYIPGFADKVVGIKEGEERTFTLPFPSEHYQKHLAGKEVDFTVKAKQIYKMEFPELNEEFAKSLGMEQMEKLKEAIRHNLSLEEEGRAREKSEIEMLEKLVDQGEFSEIAELLVNQEVDKMIREMEHSVEERGMKMEDYLQSIKRTRDELKLDFVPQAMRRIRTATLIKAIAKKEGITVSDEELDKETDRILHGIKEEDKEVRERVSSPEYREYLAIMMRNRKALELLKKQCIKDYPKEEEHVHGPNCNHDH
ncbi:trigger factor [Candidatus Uhrbacteria bacterium]|nr:trigger factor [Candidatus Uhrbacteria bacterium]MBD3284176.1 trigger factor [Candidatus Uhrbacteria bacterium]